MRDTMERIERADEDDPARAGAGPAHRPQADLQPPGPVPQAVRAVRLTGRSEKLDLLDELLGTVLAEDGAVLVFTQYVAMARLLEAHLAQAGRAPPVPARRHAGARAGGDGGAVPGRRGAGVPAVAQGRRHRPQPHPRRPRHPRRPLVEPRRRGAGHRPRLPDRPDQAGAGAPDGHAGHHRGADRRAAHPQARAGRLRARPRARPRSPSSATTSCATWSPCAGRTTTTSGTATTRDRRRCTRGSPPARGSVARARTWWGKAWVRAVEEAAYAETRPAPGPQPGARRAVGGITVDAGSFLAAVADGRRGLDRRGGAAGARRGGRAGAGRGGRGRGRAGSPRCSPASCRFALVEHAEETGVELLPYGGELDAACTCDAWLDPCPHALAVLNQLAWLVEADPLVLFQLRGLPRDELLAAPARPAPSPSRGVGAATRTSSRARRGAACGAGARAARRTPASRSTTCSEPPRAELARAGSATATPRTRLHTALLIASRSCASNDCLLLEIALRMQLLLSVSLSALRCPRPPVCPNS